MHKGAASLLNGPSGALLAGCAIAFALWPQTMTDFLSRRLRGTFEVRAYLLDPAALQAPADGIARPQALPAESEPLDGDPFQGLIQIDEITAQRGFGHAGAARSARGDDAADDPQDNVGGKKLSTQLRSYYTHHLDPFDRPEPHDL